MKLFQFTLGLTLSLFLAASPAAGQNWAVGLHFGENLSTLRGNAKTDYQLGFMAGFHVSHYLTKNVVLRLESNLERKGTRVEDPTLFPDPGTPNFVDDYQFDYLSLPIMLRYSSNSKVKFVVGGGASLDYLVRQRTDYGETEANQIDDYRKLDTDLLGVVGGAVPIGKKWTFSIEMRGMWGLVNVDKPKGLTPELGKNLTWGLMAGVNYYL